MQQQQPYELVAVRIKDGIFAGNIVAAEDREFLEMNKISHIVNCAGGEIADFFAGSPELKYLTFPWKDTIGSVCTTVLFDPVDEAITHALNFMDEAITSGSCVLVHSYFGVSRSPALIAAYFVVKYGWKLESALAFLQMAHPDMSIKPHFMRQLRLFGKRHAVDYDIFDGAIDDSEFGLDNDQWMLRNTLLNGLSCIEQQRSELYKKCTANVDVGAVVGGGSTAPNSRVSFVDTHQGTHVASAETAPVKQHVDPFATDSNTFTGAAGAVTLHGSKPSVSILRRSTSPCLRRLESESSLCPKGRQTLKLVESPREATHETPPRQPSTPPSSRLNPELPGARTSSSQSLLASATTADGICASPGPRQPSPESTVSKVLRYERLAPPMSGGAPSHHSPFAALSGKHKYRNGSPLPLFGKASAKTESSAADRTKSSTVTSTSVGGRTRISSSPSTRPLGPPTSPTIRSGSPSNLRGNSSKRAGSRTGSCTPAIDDRILPSRGGHPTGVTRARSSGYSAIAPQRPTVQNPRPNWNTQRSGDRPTLMRPLSPSSRAGSRNHSAHSHTSVITTPRTNSQQRSSSVVDSHKPPKRSGSASKASSSDTARSQRAESSGNRLADCTVTTSRSGVVKRSASTVTAGPSGGTNNSVRRDSPVAIPSRRH